MFYFHALNLNETVFAIQLNSKKWSICHYYFFKKCRITNLISLWARHSSPISLDHVITAHKRLCGPRRLALLHLCFGLLTWPYFLCHIYLPGGVCEIKSSLAPLTASRVPNQLWSILANKLRVNLGKMHRILFLKYFEILKVFWINCCIYVFEINHFVKYMVCWKY